MPTHFREFVIKESISSGVALSMCMPQMTTHADPDASLIRLADSDEMM
jgi:hypothetical protein